MYINGGTECIVTPVMCAVVYPVHGIDRDQSGLRISTALRVVNFYRRWRRVVVTKSGGKNKNIMHLACQRRTDEFATVLQLIFLSLMLTKSRNCASSRIATYLFSHSTSN